MIAQADILVRKFLRRTETTPGGDNVNRTGRQFCAAAAPRAYMAWPHFSDLATFARVADCTTSD